MCIDPCHMDQYTCMSQKYGIRRYNFALWSNFLMKWLRLDFYRHETGQIGLDIIILYSPCYSNSDNKTITSYVEFLAQETLQ